MAASTATKLPPNEQVGRRDLMLGILVWFLHQNLVYQFNSVACKWAFLSRPAAGITVLQWVELVITLIAAAAMAYLIYRPWQAWRRIAARRPINDRQMIKRTEDDRDGFMAFVAMGLNIFLLLFVIFSILPVLALKACGQA